MQHTAHKCLWLVATLAALAGCALPSAVSRPRTVGTGGLGGGALANVLALGSGLTVSIAARQPALLALSSRQSLPGPVLLGVLLAGSKPGSAYQSLSVGDTRASADQSLSVGDTRASAYQSLSFDTTPASSFQNLPPGVSGRAARRARPFEIRGRVPSAFLTGPRPPARLTLLATPSPQVGDKATFWVVPRSDSQTPTTDHQVHAHAAYVGPHCLVMIDDTLKTSLDARALDMGRTFDAKIFDTDTRLFGTPAGPAAGPVTLLLSPEVGDRGREPTIGYFSSRDLFKPSDAPADADLAHSNQRPMLYISSFVVEQGNPADYLGTIAHEFQHLINASQKLFGHPTLVPQEEVWLDEGLAMYAMQANGYGLESDASVVYDHVASYLDTPAVYSLTDWDRDPQGSAYGAVYLFITYLADRFGEGLLKELVASKETGIANVRARLAIRGADFDKVFDDWVGANMIDGTGISSDPHYRYVNLDLMGTYNGRDLQGVTVTPVAVPDSASFNMLPYSAGYLLLQGVSDAKYQVKVGNTQVSGLLVTPR
jgi:hypothetical protein